LRSIAVSSAWRTFTLFKGARSTFSMMMSSSGKGCSRSWNCGFLAKIV